MQHESGAVDSIPAMSPRIERTSSDTALRSEPRALELVAPGGDSVALDPGEPLVVGQDPQAHIVLRDPFVSRRHVRLTWAGHAVELEDLGSKNGTFVDGVPLRAGWVCAGSRIRVGRQILTLRHASPTHDQNQTAREADALQAMGCASSMLGVSQAFVDLRRSLSQFAALPHPVLLRGETGTGKELAAKTLHDASRRKGPFLALNCATLTPQRAESELFGHVKGAFTDAHRDHRGAFERTDRGTLFLDELGELPTDTQAKLLRVLETGRFLPLGSAHEKEVDVRVIAATHRDLDEMVRFGSFREDLFHRLDVLTVRIPSLRERVDDIPLLLDFFVARANREVGRAVPLSPDAVTRAMQYAWPGNIRELQHAALRAVIAAPIRIEAEHLLGPQSETDGPSSPPMVIPKGDYRSMNRHLIEKVYQEHGSLRKAAIALGVPKSTLWNWLRRAPG